MNRDIITLNLAKVGDTVKIDCVNCCESERKLLQNLGLIYGTKVKVLQKGPFGDPTAFLIRGAVIALREESTKNILCSSLSQVK